jgi:hypothetical protein
MHKVLCLLLALSAAGSASAMFVAPSVSLAQPAAFVRYAGGMSLDEAVAMVQRRYGARAVRSNTVEENGRTVHYIRLISADRSRVWTVRIDAASGQEF